MKKFLIAAAAALTMATVATTASAQHGMSHSGGGWSGGSHSGGSWHGGGDWHGGGWHGGGWHGSRIGLSLGFGFPYYYWGPGYYGYPYPYAYAYPYGYYDGYSSYDDAVPQTYIQRDSGDQIAPPAAPAQRSQYSYYCTNPAGYYPQIANCPSGWLTVVPNSAPRTAPAPR